MNIARTNPIDTYYADQICYTTDVSRAHSECFGISNAIELFKKSYLYSLYPKVIEEVEIEKQAFIANIPLRDFPFSQHKMLLMREALFDNFLGRLYPIARQKWKDRVSFSQNSSEGKRKDADSAKRDYTRVAPV